MNTLKFISILSLFGVSCNHTDKTKENIFIPNDSTQNFQVRIIKNIDTTFYIPIKDGFYKTSKGDIYELKQSAGEDSLGWYELYFLDSTIAYGDYSNKKPLKDFLDINSYSKDSISNFSKDKNNVYYIMAQSDKHVRFIIEKADPKTFVGLKDRWGKDSRHIFYETEIVKRADPKTFQVDKNSNDTAIDKSHIYYRGGIIK